MTGTRTQPMKSVCVLNRVERATVSQNPVSRNAAGKESRPFVFREWGGERVWSVWLCYAAFLILLLLVPLDIVGLRKVHQFAEIDWLDKIVHFALFACLTGIGGCAIFPFCRDANTTLERLTPGRLVLLISITATLGVGLEFLQPFFGRSFDWLDMLANLFAIIPGLGLFLVLNELRHQLLNGEW